MSSNQLTTTNQNSKLALAKSKSLLDVTNKILANRSDSLAVAMAFDIFVETKGHTDHVLSVAISRDNKYIVSGSSDETIKLWDFKIYLELYFFII